MDVAAVPSNLAAVLYNKTQGQIEAYTISAMMEALSDHAALGGIIGTDLYQKPGLSRIFIAEGAANLTGSLVGGLGICSYGEGVACVGCKAGTER